MTNLLATILVTVVTNISQPLQVQVATFYVTSPPQEEKTWIDAGPHCGSGTATRLNPDVKDIEVVEIRTLRFVCEGKEHAIVLSTRTVSKTSMVRRVKTEETWVEMVTTNHIGKALEQATSVSGLWYWGETEIAR